MPELNQSEVSQLLDSESLPTGNVVSVGDHGIYPFVMIVQFKDEQAVRDAVKSGAINLTMFEPAVRRPFLVVDDQEQEVGE